MLCDCHLHTEFSGDSETPVRAQLEKAISLGMKTICITDHHDYSAPGSPPTGEDGTSFMLDFDTYIPALRAVREEYRDRIELLIGVELGLELRNRDYLKDLVGRYGDSFDFIIGSSHCVDHLDPYFPKYFTLSPLGDGPGAERERYERYFDVTRRRIETLDCFDSFGHLDYIVRYGPNRNRFYSFDSYRETIEPVLAALIRHDRALEVNTGGFKYGLGHPNPHEDIIRRYREMGGRLITVGSDAHVPEYVGYEFGRTREILCSCGFREYTVYRGRKPEFVPL